MLELSITRIFSVVFFYHFAFLSISIALFGLGAGGVLSYVITGRSGSIYSSLGKLALANSLSVAAALWFLLSRTGGLTYVKLATVYFAAAVPFCLAGAVVSMVIAEAIDRVDRAYFFDLMGAATGCLALIFLLNVFGAPNTVIAVAVIHAAAAAIWFNLAGSAKGQTLA